MGWKPYKYVLFLYVFKPMSLSAVSIVYNFRIAQITKEPITLERKSDRHHTFVALAFDQFNKKYDGTRRNFIGGLGSCIYDFNAYYARVDCAASHIKERVENVTTFSDTQTDDILFTVGRNFIINKHVDVTLSGLFGVPTHRIFRLQHVDFGYSQVGTGIQFDGIYGFHNKRALLYGLRYIYFVPRKARDDMDKEYLFTLGNVGDLFLAYKHNWDKYGIEAGYTARARFGAAIHPHLDEVVRKTNYMRSNFYAVYKYRFSTGDIAHRFLFNISYGFDHKPKVFGNKYIITLWASWNISF